MLRSEPRDSPVTPRQRHVRGETARALAPPFLDAGSSPSWRVSLIAIVAALCVLAKSGTPTAGSDAKAGSDRTSGAANSGAVAGTATGSEADGSGTHPIPPGKRRIDPNPRRDPKGAHRIWANYCPKCDKASSSIRRSTCRRTHGDVCCTAWDCAEDSTHWGGGARDDGKCRCGSEGASS